MKAIETIYNGYRFRSRLEARWAVFFDTLGIRYEYEPEGFILSNGEHYLPDFFLPDLMIYVEVKPCNAFEISHPGNDYVAFDQSAAKYLYFTADITQAGYGMWFVFGDPYDALLTDDYGGNGKNELFCLADCPAKVFSKSPKDTCIHDGKEMLIADCKYKPQMTSGEVCAVGHDVVYWMVSEGLPVSVKAIPVITLLDQCADEKIHELVQAVQNERTKTFNAMAKARQARFEHGETFVPAHKKTKHS